MSELELEVLKKTTIYNLNLSLEIKYLKEILELEIKQAKLIKGVLNSRCNTKDIGRSLPVLELKNSENVKNKGGKTFVFTLDPVKEGLLIEEIEEIEGYEKVSKSLSNKLSGVMHDVKKAREDLQILVPNGVDPMGVIAKRFFETSSLEEEKEIYIELLGNLKAYNVIFAVENED